VPLYANADSCTTLLTFDQHTDLYHAVMAKYDSMKATTLPVLLAGLVYATRDVYGNRLRKTTAARLSNIIAAVDPLNALNRAAMLYLQKLPGHWPVVVGVGGFCNSMTDADTLEALDLLDGMADGSQPEWGGDMEGSNLLTVEHTGRYRIVYEGGPVIVKHLQAGDSVDLQNGTVESVEIIGD
jgi:hypothetical protein